MSQCSNNSMNFEEVDEHGAKKFKCKVCRRSLSSKRNVLHHLHSAHGLSPVKKAKKLYVGDSTLAVPRRTKSRWKKQPGNKTSPLDCDPSNGNDPEDNALHTSGQKTRENSPDSLTPMELCLTQQDKDLNPSNSTPNESADVLPSLSSEEMDCTSMEGNHMRSKGSDNVRCTDDMMSSIDSTSDFSDEGSETGDSDAECSSVCSEDSSYQQTEDSETALSDQEKQGLQILSCFIKHNLSASASKDILGLMKGLFPDSPNLKNLSYDKIWKLCGEVESKEYHYCHLCGDSFPLGDRDAYICQREGCNGLRYQGSLAKQMKPGRQPQRSFIIADVKKQLVGMLEAHSTIDVVKKTKSKAAQNNTGLLCDIHDGDYYKGLLQPGHFLFGEANQNITATFNTDGIALYSSTKTELWPIFLAINELPPKQRFARENMPIVGIWQGRGKPPFEQFLQAFSKEMNVLYHEGVQISVKGSCFTVKVATICGVLDLQAKAGALNMTLFNGAEACITCEEPGFVARQGKGHARCYPYRMLQDRHEMREAESVLRDMSDATTQHRIRGFKGVSGLATLESFDIPLGTVPDYMHGVLLGVTKSLMYKWFSPTHSGKEYFVGKKLKEISKRLKNIKPLDYMQRLPRDLEKHYQDMKATEYQAWLLFYGLPCLQDILPDSYLEHFGRLSEAIYILLGDAITNEELERAKYLLDTFYSEFAGFYGEGSCGLNVHNVGAHLVHFVKQWGPLWAWSCFAFEDSNSMILQAVHGTGNVTKQVIRFKEAQALLLRGTKDDPKPYWTRLQPAEGCAVAGALQPFQVQDDGIDINFCLQKTQACSETCLKKVFRVQAGPQRFYSQQYTRMEKKICFFVFTESEEVASVIYFLQNTSTTKVFAVVEFYEQCASNLDRFLCGKHLKAVAKATGKGIIPIEQLKEKIFFIDTGEGCPYIARVPNMHGHAVFK